jgi:CRISPR-associated endoribonuclease Cas6
MMAKALFSIHMSFRPATDVIVPPFSAKASRLLMHRLSLLYPELAQRQGPFKPVSITPILYNGSPLIKTEGDRPLMLRAGEPYSFRATLIIDEGTTMDKLVSLETPRVDGFFNSSIILDSITLQCKRFDELGLGDVRLIKMRLLSPALLQLPSYGRHLSGRHMLFPLPSLIVRSLADHWNAHCDVGHAISGPAYLQFYANYALMEADYALRPVTVYYDKIRRPRGFMGWVLYEVRRRRRGKAFKRLMKLLDYARYVGIGRSRATGFGQVALEWQ